ncbi:UNVERIFIED_CONTAM: Lgmn [Trichonephila clavipes]
MAVLKGDEKTLAGVGSGKVRKSGPSDHVFVYFADHGAPGLIAFPEDELSAMDLNRTINKHVRKKQHENNSLKLANLGQCLKIYCQTT